MVTIWEQAEWSSEVSDSFSCHFQEGSTDCCDAQGQVTVSLFCSLQVDLVTRSPVPETSCIDLNLFWSWKENFISLNLIIPFINSLGHLGLAY